MAQTSEGAIKVRAKKLGITIEDYKALGAAGNKYCWKCSQWRKRSEFCSDKSRFDGLSSICGECRRVKVRVSTKGRPSPMKGQKMSEESRRRIGLASKGRSSTRKGVRRSTETRKRISETVRQRGPKGARCRSYKDGKLAERRGLRFSSEYKRWRFDVFARDGFACVECGDKRGGNLNAHHIKFWADHPELRFDVSNGKTLCADCHKKVHAKEKN